MQYPKRLGLHHSFCVPGHKGEKLGQIAGKEGAERNGTEDTMPTPTSPQCQQTYLNKKVVKASAWQMGEGGWLVAGVP